MKCPRNAPLDPSEIHGKNRTSRLHTVAACLNRTMNRYHDDSAEISTT